MSDRENELPCLQTFRRLSDGGGHIYITVGDLRRAINALAAYRKSVTMSAQRLADAMKLEIECRLLLNDKTRAKEIATDFIRRFPGHPMKPI